MKIAYSHLVQHIEENPSMEEVSNSLFQLGHEHEIDGNIFDMEFTPNRGDCLSIYGTARDLAAYKKKDVKKRKQASNIPIPPGAVGTINPIPQDKQKITKK